MANSKARIVIEHILPYRVVVYDHQGKLKDEYPARSRWGAENIVRELNLKHLTVTPVNKR